MKRLSVTFSSRGDTVVAVVPFKNNVISRPHFGVLFDFRVAITVR